MVLRAVRAQAVREPIARLEVAFLEREEMAILVRVLLEQLSVLPVVAVGREGQANDQQAQALMVRVVPG
jgi:hypothetical protein